MRKYFSNEFQKQRSTLITELFDRRKEEERREEGASCTLIVPGKKHRWKEAPTESKDKTRNFFRRVENLCPIPFIRAIFGAQVTNIRIHVCCLRCTRTCNVSEENFFSFSFSPRSNMPNRTSKGKKKSVEPRFVHST